MLHKVHLVYNDKLGFTHGDCEISSSQSLGQLKLAYDGTIQYSSLAITQHSEGIFYVDAGNKTTVTLEFKAGAAPPTNDSQLFSDFQQNGTRSRFPTVSRQNAESVKIQYCLSLTLPGNLTAVSNTRLESDVPDTNKYHRLEFRPTPLLPSYLVAWRILPISSRPILRTLGNIQVRLFTSTWCEYFFPIIDRTVKYLENIFDLPFTNHKLDVVPVDGFSGYGIGASENHGLITLTRTLTRPRTSYGASDYARIVLTLIHEITHHWIGNCITCRDWRELWINEGLTCWITKHAIGELWPELNFETLFYTEYLSRLIIQDLNSKQSIRPDTDDRQDLVTTNPEMSRFDAILYDKSTVILDGLTASIPDLGLVDLLRRLLQQYQFSYLDYRDLCKAIDSNCREQAMQYLDYWLHQHSRPQIRVIFKETTVTIDNPECAVVGLYFRDSGATTKRVWISEPSTVISVKPGSKLTHDYRLYCQLVPSSLTSLEFRNPLAVAVFLNDLPDLIRQQFYSSDEILNFFESIDTSNPTIEQAVTRIQAIFWQTGVTTTREFNCWLSQVNANNNKSGSLLAYSGLTGYQPVLQLNRDRVQHLLRQGITNVDAELWAEQAKCFCSSLSVSEFKYHLTKNWNRLGLALFAHPDLACVSQISDKIYKNNKTLWNNLAWVRYLAPNIAISFVEHEILRIVQVTNYTDKIDWQNLVRATFDRERLETLESLDGKSTILTEVGDQTRDVILQAVNWQLQLINALSSETNRPQSTEVIFLDH